MNASKLTYLSVEHGNILNPCILNVIQNTRILADGAHAHTVGTVAPEVLNVDVASVGLGREAVVTDVHVAVCDADALDVQSVPAISVLREGADVVRGCFDVDVIERDVVRADEEIGPAG